MSQGDFFRGFFSACVAHFYENLQFTTMKVYCWEKTFSPLTKILEIPPAIDCSVQAYPCVKTQHHSSIQSWHISDLILRITFERFRCA